MTPVTSEATWLASLRSTPRWDLPKRRTVVIAPHPDDETLGAGGLIAIQRFRGVPVLVVAVTDGEAAYPNSYGLGDVRCREQEQALSELGLDREDVIRLKLPDSSVAEHEETLVCLLRPFISRDTLLIAPWSLDPHPDHEATGRAAQKVAGEVGATVISWLFWAWHRNNEKSLASLPLARLELDNRAQAARAAALSHHQSQLTHASGCPVLPELLLSPARRSFETFIIHD
jgi:LmbE family N-acetylglucosaminyl deacetylase